MSVSRGVLRQVVIHAEDILATRLTVAATQQQQGSNGNGGDGNQWKYGSQGSQGSHVCHMFVTCLSHVCHMFVHVCPCLSMFINFRLISLPSCLVLGMDVMHDKACRAAFNAAMIWRFQEPQNFEWDTNGTAMRHQRHPKIRGCVVP